MDDEVRALLRDVAPTPTSALDFERLWRQARRRRRVGHVGGAAALMVVVGATAAIASSLGGDHPGGLEVADGPLSHCPATSVEDGGFVPPDPYPPQPEITGGVWYGSDELWTVVVPDGPAPARSLWWSERYEGGSAEPRPDIEVVYERLDDVGTAPIVLDEATHVLGDKDSDFIIAGMAPAQPGCWQVTATYRDAELQLVLDSRE